MENKYSKIIFVTHPLWPQMVPRTASVESEADALRIAINNLPTPKTTFEVNSAFTSKETRDFITNELLPTIEKAQRNAVFVLVKTPSPAQYAAAKLGRYELKVAAGKYGFGDYEKLKFEQKEKLAKILENKFAKIYRLNPVRLRNAYEAERQLRAILKRKFGGRVIEPSGKRYGIMPLQIANETGNMMEAKKIHVTDNAVVVGLGAFAEQCSWRYAASMQRQEEGRRLALPRRGVAWQKNPPNRRRAKRINVPK